MTRFNEALIHGAMDAGQAVMENHYGAPTDPEQAEKSLRRDVLAVVHGASPASLHKAWLRRKRIAQQIDPNNEAMHPWPNLPPEVRQPFVDFVNAVVQAKRLPVFLPTTYEKAIALFNRVRVPSDRQSQALSLSGIVGCVSDLRDATATNEHMIYLASIQMHVWVQAHLRGVTREQFEKEVEKEIAECNKQLDE